MKLLNKFSVATAGLIALLALAPSSASAGGGIRLSLPGLSIGVHDDHGHKYRHKKYRHKKYSRRYNRDRYYDRDDYRSSRHERRQQRRQYYNDRHDGKRQYYGSRYYEGRRNNRSYNYPSRVEICPRAGYSPYYLRDSECRSHKDHFHCTIY